MNSMRVVASGLFLYAMLLMPTPALAQFSATPFTDPATGERYHVEASGVLWNPPPDLQVSSENFGILGTTIDAVTDLGVTKKRIGELRFVLRPARKHKFRVNYLPITYTAEASVHRNFTFNGVVYPANIPVKTEFSWTTWLVGYEYDFLYHDRWFVGFVAQAKFTNVSVELVSPISSDFARAQAPIPNVGGIVRYYVVPNISVTGEFVGIKLPESLSDDYRAHYFDFDIYGTVNFNDYVGAQVGYRRLDVNYLVDRDRGDFKMKGIYFGGVVRY